MATHQLNLLGVPVLPEIKKEVIPVLEKPVIVRFRKDHYTDALNFRCPYYHSRGADPDYVRGQYNNDSQHCSRTVLIKDGVKFTAPFQCWKENNGTEYWPHWSLINGSPLDHVPRADRLTVMAGLKLLWRLA